MAAAALLADHGKLRLQRIEIGDLALGVADRLGEACDVLIEARLVVPDLVRGTVVAVKLRALEACGKQRRKLFSGIVELGERGIDGRLIVRLFALNHGRERAGI